MNHLQAKEIEMEDNKGFYFWKISVKDLAASGRVAFEIMKHFEEGYENYQKNRLAKAAFTPYFWNEILDREAGCVKIHLSLPDRGRDPRYIIVSLEVKTNQYGQIQELIPDDIRTAFGQLAIPDAQQELSFA